MTRGNAVVVRDPRDDPECPRESNRRRMAEALGLNAQTTAVASVMFVMGLGENLWRRFLPKYLESFGAPITAIGFFGTAEDLLDGVYQ
jgi:hypothetical protein